MPTVLRNAGYRFYFYSHEPNEPAHVHVDNAGCTAKFWLEPIALAGSSALPRRTSTLYQGSFAIIAKS
jgi:hypothetical protein